LQAVLNNFKLLFYNGTLDGDDGIFVKFLIDNIWLILLALVSGGALAWPSLTRGKHSLSTLQAIQLLNKGKVSIVDVRKSDEFSALDKTHPVLVVCQSGVRASRAAAEFRRAGFGEVYILDGGYTEWRSQGLPVAN
jgi:rhodanese-related sulfurtransferase